MAPEKFALVIYGNSKHPLGICSLSKSPMSQLKPEDVQKLHDDYLVSFRDGTKAQRVLVVKEAFKALWQLRGKDAGHGSRPAFKKVSHISAYTHKYNS